VSPDEIVEYAKDAEAEKQLPEKHEESRRGHAAYLEQWKSEIKQPRQWPADAGSTVPFPNG
jgi:hypothetical protein